VKARKGPGATSKVRISPDKRAWRTSPMPGLIALVTTCDRQGRVNVAPKSWLSMIAFKPPTVVLGCNVKHRTAKNILATGEFVLNFPPGALSPAVWSMPDMPGPRSVEALGLTPASSQKVSPPRIGECRSHLECRLVGSRRFGAEIALFGRIVAASLDRGALKGDPEARYRALDPIFFLEDGLFAPLGRPRRVRVRRR